MFFSRFMSNVMLIIERFTGPRSFASSWDGTATFLQLKFHEQHRFFKRETFTFPVPASCSSKSNFQSSTKWSVGWNHWRAMIFYKFYIHISYIQISIRVLQRFSFPLHLCLASAKARQESSEKRPSFCSGWGFLAPSNGLNKPGTIRNSMAWGTTRDGNHVKPRYFSVGCFGLWQIPEVDL